MAEFEDKPIGFSVSDESLSSAGFTNSGKKRFNDTTSDYVRDLFEKSKLLADISRGEGLPREVTHEHVRSAAVKISLTYGKPITPRWVLPCQALEYMSTAGLGYAGSQLDKPWGVKLALGCFISLVLLFVLRTNRGKAE